jgi:hypothetical protein
LSGRENIMLHVKIIVVVMRTSGTNLLVLLSEMFVVSNVTNGDT